MMTPEEIVSRFEAHAGIQARNASRLIRNRIPAEDLKQEALISALHHYPRYKPGKGELDTWIGWKMGFAIQDAIREELHTRTKDHNHSRVLSSDARLMEDGSRMTRWVPAVNPWPATEAGIDLRRVASCLKPRHRKLIAMRLEGHEGPELSRSLAVNRSRVSQLEAWCLDKMREEVAA